MNTKGFTLVETIFTLVIVAVCTTLLSTLVAMIASHQYRSYESEDETSIEQMRLLFTLSKEAYIEDDMLCLNYFMEDMYFVLEEDKLLLKEGYQVFFKELEEAVFQKEEECIYLSYRHIGKTHQKRMIGCE